MARSILARSATATEAATTQIPTPTTVPAKGSDVRPTTSARIYKPPRIDTPATVQSTGPTSAYFGPRGEALKVEPLPMSVPEPVPVAPPVPESVPVTTPNTAKSPPVKPGKAVAVATGAAIAHNVGKVPQPDVDMDLHEKRRRRSGCFMSLSDSNSDGIIVMPNTQLP
jgi:hypothetical protein